ncbi:MAG: helix-turn-helix transcriptional regulator [Bacteroidales bacterium]|nr:helix-turn-helix transcriptional regulator [Bacteroidales bacterium]
MAKFKLTPLSDIVDEVWGPIGTPERDAMEAQLDEELKAYHLGETIRDARLKQHLTQEELGARIGVQRAQICKLERGRNAITLSTMEKVFKALGFESATLDLGSGVRLALW